MRPTCKHNKFLLPTTFVSLLVLIVTIQAMYWPLVNKPGSTEWWQIEFLADIGYIVGFPVIAIAYFIQNSFLSTIVSLVWSSIIGYVFYRVLIFKNHEHT